MRPKVLWIVLFQGLPGLLVATFRLFVLEDQSHGVRQRVIGPRKGNFLIGRCWRAHLLVRGLASHKNGATARFRLVRRHRQIAGRLSNRFLSICRFFIHGSQNIV